MPKEKSTEVAVRNNYLSEPTNVLLAELSMPISEVQLENLFDAFIAMPDENFVSICNTYKKFEKGIVYDIIATGLSTIDNKFKNEKNPAEGTEVVEFMCKENGEVKKFINADAVFVNEVKKLIEKFPNSPYFVLRILNEGDKISKNGTYQRITISQLAA